MVEQKRASMSLSLPAELKKKLYAEAEARVLNPSVLVEKALEKYLPTLPPLNVDASTDDPQPK